MAPVVDSGRNESSNSLESFLVVFAGKDFEIGASLSLFIKSSA